MRRATDTDSVARTKHRGQLIRRSPPNLRFMSEPALKLCLRAGERTETRLTHGAEADTRGRIPSPIGPL
jgi:hypothetical protein